MTLTYQGKLFAEYPDVVSVKQMLEHFILCRN